jgi:putative ABC transport system substrate-binding protein
VRRVGGLTNDSESDPITLSLLAAVRGALAKLGWTEGSNLRIELRSGNGDAERIKTFAKDLVALQPDVILTFGTANTTAVQRESRLMPIVFVIVSDPIGSGFAANLTHPGGIPGSRTTIPQWAANG